MMFDKHYVRQALSPSSRLPFANTDCDGIPLIIDGPRLLVNVPDVPVPYFDWMRLPIVLPDASWSVSSVPLNGNADMLGGFNASGDLFAISASVMAGGGTGSDDCFCWLKILFSVFVSAAIPEKIGAPVGSDGAFVGRDD
jgi:hypothetical protein